MSNENNIKRNIINNNNLEKNTFYRKSYLKPAFSRSCSRCLLQKKYLEHLGYIKSSLSRIVLVSYSSLIKQPAK